METLHEATGITDEIVAAVNDNYRLFPDVVIALTDHELQLDPGLDKLSVMRRIRDELNTRINQ